MKTVKSNGITVIAASALLTIMGVSTIQTADAGHRDRRCENSLYSNVRTLDVLTDRLHSMAKRELRYGRDARRTIAMICDLEDRADRLRSSVENRAPAATVSRLACAIEVSARTVALKLRRGHGNCELSRLAFATLDSAQSVSATFVRTDDRRIDDYRIADHRHRADDRWASNRASFRRNYRGW